MGRRRILLIDRDLAELEELVQRNGFEDTEAAGRLKEKLQQAEATKTLPPGVVAMNCRVHISEPATGAQGVYKVVFPSQADASRNFVSVLAPLGTALLGARVGMLIDCFAPRGRRRLRVDQVESACGMTAVA